MEYGHEDPHARAVTADALHTQRGHARFLVEEKKAHYLLGVKANQPGLHRRLRSLPWKDVTAGRCDREIGDGRRETRATRALTVTELDLDFPHAVQAVRIVRHRTDPASGNCSHQAIYWNSPGEAVLGERVAGELGLRAGQDVLVRFADGLSVTLHVGAVLADDPDRGDFVVSRDLVRAHDPAALTNDIFVPGDDRATDAVPAPPCTTSPSTPWPTTTPMPGSPTASPTCSL
ncbi:hypothetical protein [Kitasatospora sp. NPDC050463]|uniref:hypothetical protein n=1 Tax=Kitasatospora sp. NPDC050463 TaxID=3155786 RepID=UPI0033DB9586